MAAHVALGAVILARSQQFLEYLSPILHRLVVYLYDNIFDDGWADSFVSQGKMNVGSIAGLVLEDRPDRRAHLLALHPSGITGNTQSQESDKGRNDCVVSAGAARLLFLRHGVDLIAGRVSVNQAIPSVFRDSANVKCLDLTPNCLSSTGVLQCVTLWPNCHERRTTQLLRKRRKQP